MKLYLLRHGDAFDHGDPRFKERERPLTPKGIQQTRQLAHDLRKQEITFSAILSSPLTRARQTAEIAARGSGAGVELTEALAPDGSVAALVEQLNRIRPAPESALLVGHEPYLSALISLLCAGGPGVAVRMKKGALCRLEVEQLICGKCAILEWLIHPRWFGERKRKRIRPKSR